MLWLPVFIFPSHLHPERLLILLYYFQSDLITVLFQLFAITILVWKSETICVVFGSRLQRLLRRNCCCYPTLFHSVLFRWKWQIKDDVILSQFKIMLPYGMGLVTRRKRSLPLAIVVLTDVSCGSSAALRLLQPKCRQKDITTTTTSGNSSQRTHQSV